MTRVAKALKVVKVRKVPNTPISETNIKKAAIRLLGQHLVSPEVQYIQRTLGASAPQETLDANVLAVRKMPWASIVLPD